MPVNNPYIEKVKDDTDIMTDLDKIYSHKGKWSEYFGNTKPLILEIGTGMGNFFGKQVGEHPETNFIGMEIKYKRLFQTAEKSRRGNADGEKNNFLLLKDFGQNIDRIFSEGEISESYIFFPDPWGNKERQKKHRIMLKPFLENLYAVTKTGGKVFFKTDHLEYFDSTVELIQEQNLWTIEHKTHDYENSELFNMKNITEFEGFYRGEKTEINYLELSKTNVAPKGLKPSVNELVNGKL